MYSEHLHWTFFVKHCVSFAIFTYYGIIHVQHCRTSTIPHHSRAQHIQNWILFRFCCWISFVISKTNVTPNDNNNNMEYAHLRAGNILSSTSANERAEYRVLKIYARVQTKNRTTPESCRCDVLTTCAFCVCAPVYACICACCVCDTEQELERVCVRM